MMRKDGAEILRTFTEQNYQEKVTQVCPGLWHVLGIGHSNAIFVEGDTSVILIDTLDTLERGERLQTIIQRETGKAVKTIFYTHGHPDHRGGAGAFSAFEPEIIAFAAKMPPLARTEQLEDILKLRGARQFGYTLTDEENISQGIGIREGIVYGEQRAFAAPATIYQEDAISREIDGVRLEMMRLPGETEDQIMIWIPVKKALCCGDNYYGCWPNLYAIRGSQYRDIAAWIDSLDVLLSYPAEHLLPGHTAVISGRKEISEVLGNFRNAIDYVLNESLAGMKEGKGIDQLAAEVRLPQQYAALPYLGEHYGCVEWTVRAIYTAYLGWFDGNPAKLHPLSPKAYADKSLALMGGRQSVWEAAAKALKEEDYQWCLELCDLLLAHEGPSAAVYRQKASALEKIAAYETSANGRHYYLVCAQELRKASQEMTT